MCPVKNPIRLSGCPGCSESSQGAKTIIAILVNHWPGSLILTLVMMNILCTTPLPNFYPVDLQHSSCMHVCYFPSASVKFYRFFAIFNDFNNTCTGA